MSWEVVLFACGICIIVMLSLVLLVMLDRQRIARKTRLARAANGFVHSKVQTDDVSADATQKRRERPALLERVMGRLETARQSAGFQFSLHELLAQFGMGVMGLYAASVLVLNMSPLAA